MAEFRITEQTMPGAITFNYEELKAEIEQKAKTYETLVYTEETMAEAKADKANLNKLKKALNDERIKREREFMLPFEDFKKKVNEIIAIIDKPVMIIDKQVKEYEESEKQKKKEKIEKIWADNTHPEWISLSQIWNEKWLNKSFTEKAIREEIEQAMKKVDEDLTAINSFQSFSFEAMETYKHTLDLGKAIAEGQRLAEIQKRKAEAEERARAAELEKTQSQPEQPLEKAMPEIKEEEKPQGSWVSFQAFLTTPQALMLKHFFEANRIEFRPIKN